MYRGNNLKLFEENSQGEFSEKSSLVRIIKLYHILSSIHVDK